MIEGVQTTASVNPSNMQADDAKVGERHREETKAADDAKAQKRHQEEIKAAVVEEKVNATEDIEKLSNKSVAYQDTGTQNMPESDSGEGRFIDLLA